METENMDGECNETTTTTTTTNQDEEDDEEDSEEETSDYDQTQRRRRKADRLNGEYTYQNIIKRRVIGPPCMDCRLKCDVRVAERFRQDNYCAFWGKLKNWEDRRVHVRRLVQLLYVPNRRTRNCKKLLRRYYLQVEDGYTIVCKTMFFNTLAVSVKFVETTLRKFPQNMLNESEIKIVNKPQSYRRIPPGINVKPPTPRTPKKTIDQKTNVQTDTDIPIEGLLLQGYHKKDMRSACDCPSKCTNLITEEARAKIHNHFWTNLGSWEERKLFIINTVERDKIMNVRSFMLPVKEGGCPQIICQEMYLNTLALNETSIDLLVPKDKEPKRKTSAEDEKPVENKPTTIHTEPHHNKSKDINDTKEAQPPVPSLRRIKLEYTPLKPPCSCNLHCSKKLTPHVREQIHKEFWNLPAQVDQQHFILSTIQTHLNGRKSIDKVMEVKSYTLPCQYDTVTVCKEMYLNTLTISENFVLKTMKNVNLDGSIREYDDDDDDLSNDTFEQMSDEQMEDSDDKSTVQVKPEIKRMRRPRLSKRIGPPCPSSCRQQCSSKFAEDDRKKIFEEFWHSMDWQQRKQFVKDTVDEFPIKNRTIPGRLTKRNFSRTYSLPLKGKNVTVCQKMYFSTLSICSKFVSTIHIWASQVKW